MPTIEDVAERSQIQLRAFLMAPTGAGKSRAAFELASRLGGGEIPVTFLNTEGSGRARLYADRFEYALYDVSEDGDFSPDAMVRAIDECERRWPGRTLILDSASHEWQGKNGVLQQADRFGDWKTIRPKHNDWIERLLAYNGHVIVTCRAKMQYEVSEEEVPGRSKPRQVVTMLGVGPIQDDRLQYEFNLVGRIDLETHDITWSGHVDPLIGTASNLGDPEEADKVVATLTDWLAKGNPLVAPERASEAAVEELLASLRLEREEGNQKLTEEKIEEGLTVGRRSNRGVLHPDWVAEKLAESRKRLEAARRKAELAQQREQAEAAEREAAEREAAEREAAEREAAAREAAAPAAT